jgi:hypothetical protein
MRITFPFATADTGDGSNRLVRAALSGGGKLAGVGCNCAGLDDCGVADGGSELCDTGGCIRYDLGSLTKSTVGASTC